MKSPTISKPTIPFTKPDVPKGIGFTGTKEGFQSQKQKTSLNNAIVTLFNRIIYPVDADQNYFDHGDCIGGDEEAHYIVRPLLFSGVKPVIRIHPPLNPKHQAKCRGDITYDKLEYLERNKNIVYNTKYLIALSKTMNEELRSGTWSTVRFARKLGRPIYIVYPDGSIKKG